MIFKKCDTCGLEKEVCDFLSKNKTHLECHSCRLKYLSSKKAARDFYLKNKYGISLKEYNDLLAIQFGKCLICETTTNINLVVDHCHVTGNVRGLLCLQCNSGLGMFKDNKKALSNAIEYLERSQIHRKGSKEWFYSKYNAFFNAQDEKTTHGIINLYYNFSIKLVDVPTNPEVANELIVVAFDSTSFDLAINRINYIKSIK